tara:strand:+ start:27641 stop:27844 length:204 start_codon:yes stop_codon:yes gene_type:complete
LKVLKVDKKNNLDYTLTEFVNKNQPPFQIICGDGTEPSVMYRLNIMLETTLKNRIIDNYAWGVIEIR